MERRIPTMNLQLFAEAQGAAGQGADPGASQAGQQADPAAAQSQQAASQIDYDKIQKMLTGTLQAKEDTALKAYFKQQGLTEQEMAQAIASYKEQKAKNQPDITGMQQQIDTAKAAARKYQIENAATLSAIQLGLEAKTIPYVLKLADLSQAIGEDGNINQEAVTNAINKVLEDLPQFKPAVQAQTGFVQVGAVVNPQQQTQSTQQNQPRVVQNKWNRFNH